MAPPARKFLPALRSAAFNPERIYPELACGEHTCGELAESSRKSRRVLSGKKIRKIRVLCG